MDSSRLSRGEMIAGVSGVALLLIMWIFSWFHYDLGPFGEDVGFDAWESFGFIDIVVFLAALAGIGLAVMAMTSTQVNAPVALSAVTAGLGILATLLVLYRLISPPDFGTDVDAGRSIGVWLGLIGSAAVAYGGWAAMQEEGTSFGGQADRLQGGGSPPPPPPPPQSPPPSDPPPPAGP